MSSPAPAKLILLRDLSSAEPGQKVRFLGCVTEPYCASSGTLELQHPTDEPAMRSSPTEEPRTAPRGCAPDDGITKLVSHPFKAVLNVEHVEPESLKGDIVSVGRWLNVIGYVDFAGGVEISDTGSIRVQAVMVWEAVGIDPKAYEKALKARHRAAESLGDN